MNTEPKLTDLIDPLTGEVLDANDAKRLIEVVQAAEAVISKHYECIRRYREPNDALKRHLAERGEYELPPKQARTKTQERLSRCPRCGDLG